MNVSRYLLCAVLRVIFFFLGLYYVHDIIMHLRDKRHVICATEVYRSFKFDDVTVSRSQWPHGLRRRSSGARLLRSWVRIPPGSWKFVCCECRVLSGRGLCDELITRPEESYRLFCVVVCDLETSKIGAPYIYMTLVA